MKKRPIAYDRPRATIDSSAYWHIGEHESPRYATKTRYVMMHIFARQIHTSDRQDIYESSQMASIWGLLLSAVLL
jgi:hypothetical protein